MKKKEEEKEEEEEKKRKKNLQTNEFSRAAGHNINLSLSHYTLPKLLETITASSSNFYFLRNILFSNLCVHVFGYVHI